MSHAPTSASAAQAQPFVIGTFPPIMLPQLVFAPIEFRIPKPELDFSSRITQEEHNTLIQKLQPSREDMPEIDPKIWHLLNKTMKPGAEAAAGAGAGRH